MCVWKFYGPTSRKLMPITLCAHHNEVDWTNLSLCLVSTRCERLADLQFLHPLLCTFQFPHICYSLLETWNIEYVCIPPKYECTLLKRKLLCEKCCIIPQELRTLPALEGKCMAHIEHMGTF